MVKKVRLLDEETTTEAVEVAPAVTGESLDTEKLMKFLEAIDWKLWELLKLERAKAGVETK
jgi:hypothetical protein